LGLIAEGDGVAARTLDQLDIHLEAARQMVEETIALSGTPPAGSPPFTPRAKKVLELALREALQLGHNYIGTEHLLLGLVREGEGVAAQVLVGLGADLVRVRQQVIHLLSGYQGMESVSASGTSLGSVAMGVSEQGALVQCSFCGRRPPDHLGTRYGVHMRALRQGMGRPSGHEDRPGRECCVS
jgi:ATP-dependent Clp protease ATP-binding subunit ClpC